MLDRVAQRVACLKRGLVRALKQALLGDDPALDGAVAEFRADLTEALEQRAALLPWQADSAARARRPFDLSALAERAAARLPALPTLARREILAMLDVRVTVLEVKDGRPAVRLEGRVDPRLFAEGGPDAAASSRAAVPARVAVAVATATAPGLRFAVRVPGQLSGTSVDETCGSRLLSHGPSQ